MAKAKPAKGRTAPARRKPAAKKARRAAAKPKRAPRTPRGPGTGAPLGNEFWKQRSRHGRNPIFATAAMLAEACEDYFQWVHDNPLQEEQLVTYQGETSREHLSKMRAMTIEGLCIFLDIDPSTWADWRKDRDKGFSGIVSRVETVIRTQKFEGASAGFLNSAIIARDLGLADRKSLEGPDGQPLAFKWLD